MDFDSDTSTPPWGPVLWGEWQPGGFRIGMAYRQLTRTSIQCKTYLQRRYRPPVRRKNSRCKPWVPACIWAESA
jgi:hypothetical protein